MGKLAGKWGGFKEAIKNDVNLNRAGRGIRRGVKAFPSAAGRYVVGRMPIVRWLPNYTPSWIINDIVAGITMGILLIPQAIAFAFIAGGSVQDGLLASWLPPVIYSIMGTSKDISVGPTSISAILTGAVIFELKSAFQIPAIVTLPAVSFAVGFLSLLMGMLNLGWLLDFVSLPIITGFMLGAGLITAQAQVPILLGETGVGLTFIEQGKGIFMQLGTAQPLTIVIGVSSILLLVVLQVIGSKFGNRHFIISTFASCRYAVVMIAFTGLSFGLNQGRLFPLWAVTGEIPTGLQAPRQPSDWRLVALVATKSMPVFFATVIEHLAVAKAFGRQNGYTIDPSTELTYLGITNIANGFFGGMPVGGTLSRTAVNSGSNVKSPLSGLFTSAVVLLGIFSLKNVLFWAPHATVAAVTAVATVQVFPPFSVMKFHWKGSFIDFLSCQLATQLAITASSAMGVGLAVFFITVYTLVRARFSKAEFIDQTSLNIKFATEEIRRGVVVQGGMCIVHLKNDVFFLNAFRVKQSIIDGLAQSYTRQPRTQNDRLWCHKREYDVSDDTYPINRSTTLKVLILDFRAVSFIDTSTITMLTDLTSEMETFTDGFDVELRFVGFSLKVQERFERCGWKLVDGGAPGGGDGLEGDRVFEEVRCAIEFPVMGRGVELDFEFEKGKGEGEEVMVRYIGF